MTEKDWLTSGSPDALLKHCWPTACARKKRLFGCACCYRLWDRLPDPRCKTAVRVAERLADGEGLPGAIDTARRALIPVVDRFTRVTYDRKTDEEQHRFSGTGACLNVASADPDHARWAWRDIANTRLEAGAKWHDELAATADLVRCVFGNPFRAAALDPDWLTSDVRALAAGIYADRAFDRMPILADALQDAGCDRDDVLTHCRDPKVAHGRGCWVCDSILGKE